MEYQPKHARRNRNMERLHTIIVVTIWSCLAITGLILADWLGREVLSKLPW